MKIRLILLSYFAILTFALENVHDVSTLKVAPQYTFYKANID